MTTPAAPGAPEAPVQGTTAPGAPAEPATQPQTDTSQNGQQAPGAPKPGQWIGKPQTQGQQPQQDPAAQQTQDVSQLPEWAQKRFADYEKDVKALRAENAKDRTGAKQQAAEEARQQLLAEFANKLGLNPDGEPNADELNEQLQQQIEELQANQTEATFQGHIRDTAAALGLDAKMLAGWGDFRDEVEAELEDEFTDEQLKAAVEKVAKTYVGRPQFAANGTAAPRSGAPMPGAPTPTKQRPRSLTEALGRAYGQGG